MDDSLRNLQLALVEMLKDIDSLCKDNSIQYSLACGTALGAVRHQGFIPWDDDLDIMLMREEYDKFLKIAPQKLREKGYTVQLDSSVSWPMTYAKVRKDNTAYIEDYYPKIKGLHQGIFIDVFPIDNLSDNKVVANLQWLFTHLLVAKGMKLRGYKSDSLYKRLAMAISPIYPEKILKHFVIQRKNTGTKKVHCYLGGAVVREHNEFPRDIFCDFTELYFEGNYYPVVSNYDHYLQICFNDYMRIPTIEEQNARVHALIFDLDRSYTFYQNNEQSISQK